MKIEIFTFLLKFLNVTLKGILIDNTARFIAGISPMVAAGFTLLVIITIGSYWVAGAAFSAMMDFIKKCAVWAFLIGFAMNAGAYSSLATLIFGLGDELGLMFLGSSNEASSMFDVLIAQITSMGDKFILVREGLWLKMKGIGITKFGEALDLFSQICAIVFLQVYFNFCFIIIMQATFSTYLFAKLGLLLVLAVGPLFIAAGLFPATRAYAMNWLGQVLNYTILTLFIAVLNSLLIALVTQSIDEFIMKNLGDVAAINGAALGMFFNMTVLTVIIFLFISKLPELTSALTGGNAGTSGMSALGSSMRSFSKGGTMQKIGAALPSLSGKGSMSSVAALLKKGGGAK